jgi:hypothetical protein
MGDVEIGKIEMRKPGGGKAFIAVHRRETGEVDLHMSRTSEGEMLARLPQGVARQLAALLQKATT